MPPQPASTGGKGIKKKATVLLEQERLINRGPSLLEMTGHCYRTDTGMAHISIVLLISCNFRYYYKVTFQQEVSAQHLSTI